MVLLALTLTLGACEAGTSFTPEYLPAPGGGNPGTSGGGGNAAVLIVGTWEATIITQLPMNDFITSETTWIFRADATCRQTIQTLQFSEGIVRTESNGCTYTLAQGVVLVLYDTATMEIGYPFSFPINNRDVLVLSGIPYDRIG